MPTFKALSKYTVMWVYVFFDLPTKTKSDRKKYADFRKSLIQDGFIMHQYSVYIRNCASNDSAEVHIKRVQSFIPDNGIVSMMKITDRQYSETVTVIGAKRKAPEPAEYQLELF